MSITSQKKAVIRKEKIMTLHGSELTLRLHLSSFGEYLKTFLWPLRT